MGSVAVGAVAEVPTDRCLAIADGTAVVVRVGDPKDGHVCAYRNRCLHQESPLADGWVRDGVLTCPLHFWRYDVATGQLSNGVGALERFPVEIRDGEVYVDIPDPEPRRSLRDELLARAETYDRTEAWYSRD